LSYQDNDRGRTVPSPLPIALALASARHGCSPERPIHRPRGSIATRPGVGAPHDHLRELARHRSALERTELPGRA